MVALMITNWEIGETGEGRNGCGIEKEKRDSGEG